ncbi:MAG: magnesium transporter [Clostridiaceae bacterium]
MEKIYNFFLSKVVNSNVYDEYEDCIGRLYDMYVMNEEGYPKIIGYKLKKDGEIINYEFRSIDFLKTDNGKMKIKIKGARNIIANTYSYLVSKHLLDKQIVDLNGKKIVKVNDVRLAAIAGEIRVVAVDTGIKARARRYNCYEFVKFILKLINKWPKDQLIMWDNLESIEMVNQSIKLNVPFKKLSKLHPADIADLLEGMDSQYRKKIFESLEENLAADTLEEIEPEIQAEILGNLSETKTAEVLDNMPNDEIADILDEVDDETVEKILTNMEKEDADEIRSLMKYGDESIGSIMNKDFISFNINITVEETIEILREMNSDEEVSYYIYITDEDGKLEGVISLKDLICSNKDSHLKEIMAKNLISVRDYEEVNIAIDIATKYNLLSVPVLDKHEKLCGIVVLHDIIDEFLLPNWKKRMKKSS